MVEVGGSQMNDLGGDISCRGHLHDPYVPTGLTCPASLLITQVPPCKALELSSELQLCPCDPQHVAGDPTHLPLQAGTPQAGQAWRTERGAVGYSTESEHNRAGPDVPTSVEEQSGQELSPGQPEH